MTDKQFLDHAYGLDNSKSTRDFYADWAATYDTEVAANGYVTPGRSAEALAQFADTGAPLLDIGCGTGLSGLAFAKAGFTTIDGCDLTPEMLERANALNLYRNLWVSEMGAPPDMSRGPYPNVAAVGVIGSGAAPLSVFHDITAAMAPGAYFVFSFNDHTLEDPAYEAAVMAADGAGFTLKFKDYDDHLPRRGMKSTVYVLQKT